MEPVSRNSILTNIMDVYKNNKKDNQKRQLVKSIQNRFHQMNSKIHNKMNTIGKNKNKKKYNRRNTIGKRLERQMKEMEELQKNHNIVKKIENEKKVIKLENLLSHFKI